MYVIRVNCSEVYIKLKDALLGAQFYKLAGTLFSRIGKYAS